jgi:putative exporter of polyketide antibiotics
MSKEALKDAFKEALKHTYRETLLTYMLPFLGMASLVQVLVCVTDLCESQTCNVITHFRTRICPQWGVCICLCMCVCVYVCVCVCVCMCIDLVSRVHVHKPGLECPYVYKPGIECVCVYKPELAWLQPVHVLCVI